MGVAIPSDLKPGPLVSILTGTQSALTKAISSSNFSQKSFTKGALKRSQERRESSINKHFAANNDCSEMLEFRFSVFKILPASCYQILIIYSLYPKNSTLLVISSWQRHRPLRRVLRRNCHIPKRLWKNLRHRKIQHGETPCCYICRAPAP